MNNTFSVRSKKTDISDKNILTLMKGFSGRTKNNLYLKRLFFRTLKKVLCLLLIVAAYIIQFTFLPRSSFPFSVYLLIPAVVAVAMFEYEFSGLFFGLFAGVLWDLASPLPDGIMAFSLALASLTVGLLSHYLLRNTLLTTLLFTSLMSILYSFFALLIMNTGLDFSEFRNIFVRFYFPSVILSVMTSVPVYLLISKVSLKLKS